MLEIDIVLVIIQGSNSVEFRDFASTVWFHFEDKIGVSWEIGTL